MKILVLGSNSFSGASFIDFMLNKKFNVIAISRSKEYKELFLKYKSNKNIKNLKFYQVNINKGYKKIFDIIDKEKPIFFINFAAQGMVNESWKNPIDWYETNIISQVRILEFLKNKKYIKKYINFTTPEVYGNISNWKKESFSFNPSTPYALSRAANDFHLRNMNKSYGFPIIFTRAANVFGESQQIYRIIPRSIINFKLNRKIILDGGGISLRSFIHIDDVCSALYKILRKGRIGETYHISTNKIISIKSLVKLIANISGYKFEKYVKIGKERRGKDHSYKLDSTKLRDLGWKDKISLEEGIDKTINWVDQNIEIIKKLPSNYLHKK